MFNPFDEHNHAGLLYGMRRSPLLGLAGPFDSRGGAGTGNPRVGQSIAQGVAALTPTRKQKLASLCGYADVAKWEKDFVAYLEKKFEKADSDYTKNAQLLFKGACAYAAEDPTVVAYFDKLIAALKAKKTFIKAENDANKGDAATKQSAVDAVDKSIGQQKDTLKVSSDKLYSAMLNFVDWVQQSMKSIFGGKLVFPDDKEYTPWAIQQAIYGQPPFFFYLYPSINAKIKTAPVFVAGSALPKSLLDSASLVDPNKDDYITDSLNPFDPWAGKRAFNNDYNFSKGPPLGDLALINTTPLADQKAWVQVDGKSAYVCVKKGAVVWRFCGKGTAVPTRLRYNGPSRNVAPEGFCATQAWNQGVVTHATNMQKTSTVINDLQAQRATLVAARDAALAAQAQLEQTKSAAQKTYDDLMGQADSLKNLLKGFLLGFADTVAVQLQAAMELDALTDAREALQAKVDALKGDADKLTANAQKLISDAESERDPEKKARMQSEAARRLRRAGDLRARRKDMIENRDPALGTLRTDKVNRLKKEAERSGFAIPVGTTTDDKGKTTTGGLPASGKDVIPKDSQLFDKINSETSTAAGNAAAVGTLNQHQQEQQKANAELGQLIRDLAEKLPEKYKPTNVPPPPPPKEEGGGLGLIVAGLVAFAALRNK